MFKLLGISEEKKNLLLLLHEGQKKKETILLAMGMSRQALVPHLRLLEQNGLITSQDGSYELTGVGKITVCEMIPFLETLEFLDKTSNLLGKYKLDFIPSNLLERFHEIGSLELKEPKLSEVHEPDKEFMSTVSTSFSVITTFLYPTFPDFTSEMMDKGVKVSVIINQAMFEKLKTDRYADFKRLVENKCSDVYLYPEDIGFVSFSLTDACIMFRLLGENNGFDNKLIMACNQNAVEWGKELFEYYKERSTVITDV
ncbi:helix-turn-helix transcriptional regulator [Methanolobus halotolerans]|uniref:Methanogenesis regulatory protein FilR1 middle domain-containing protein n=1 Tax=Methanolobus halotolerans TaxID=2052935 RepID=A0A4E0PZ20_9EURY|nr:transcriptional regulator FilR1 domain-containing protein [Methanolobus halotolerans]TGC10912.1 hypothetical protein CUN85_01790 [Methanolobus halotolerans]